MSSLFHHVAIAIVFDEHQRILISKRPDHKLKGGYWEFPGGKIETDEEAEQALIRELQEEVGIKVLSADPFMRYEYQYDKEYNVLLEVFLVKGFEGIPTSLEGQEIHWMPLPEWPNYNFLAPNKFIIEALIKK